MRTSDNPNYESGMARLFGSRLRLALLALMAAIVALMIPGAAQGDGSVYATRGDDGTSAEVSWDAYDGDSFDSYRFVVCPRDQFVGGICSDNVYDSDSYSDIDYTGPVTATGLDRYTSYAVVLEVRRGDGLPTLSFYDTIPALPEPTPEPDPTPEPTATPTPEPTPDPTATPAPASSGGQQSSDLRPARSSSNDATTSGRRSVSQAVETDDAKAQNTYSFDGTVSNQIWRTGGAVSLSLPKLLVDGSPPAFDGYTQYSLTGSLPAGMSFNGGITDSPSITGTPTGKFAEAEFTYSANLINVTNKATQKFKIKVNEQLTFGSGSISDQLLVTNASFSTLTLPSVTNTGAPSITYTLSPSLPTGMSFTGSTRQISGTPTANKSETTYTYTATVDEDSSNNASLSFKIEVRNKPPKAGKLTMTRHDTVQSTMIASWTAVTADGGVTSYEIQYRTRTVTIDGAKYTLGTWSTLTGIAASSTSKEIAGLQSGGNSYDKKYENPSVQGYNYDWRLRAKSAVGYGAWSDHVEARTSGNINPYFTKSSDTRSIAENTSAGADVGAPVTATDPDNEVSVSGCFVGHYLSGADASKFEMILDLNDRDGFCLGQITVKSGTTLDFETKSSYSVTVGASDGDDRNGISDGTSQVPVIDDTIAITISVTDVKEPPGKPDAPTLSRVTNDASKLDVSWTAPTNTGPAITDYDVRYRKSGAPTWTVLDSATSTATSTTLTGLKGRTTYEAQVRATSDEGTSPWSNSGTKNTVGNGDPAFASDTTTISIDENSTGGSTVGTVSATDADGDTLYYALSGGSDRLSFTIETTTGQIKTASALSLDYENKSSYDVTVSVTDKRDVNNNADKVIDDYIGVTINVGDVNEPPSKPGAPKVSQNAATPKTKLDVSWSAPAVPAGQPPLTGYDVQYRDSNATTTTWTAWSFSGTGTSTAIHSLTASTTYEVQVQAKNHEGASGWTNGVSATTQQPNLDPTFPSDTATRGIAENSAAGTNVGSVVTATDTEGDALTYTLGGTDATKFDIGATTGQITVKTGNVPDYEAKASYTVTVSVSDKKNTSALPDTAIDDTITVTINVTDVNEPPAAPTLTVAPAATPTTKISVSWTAPTMTGKPAISDWDVDYRLAGDSSWTSYTGTMRPRPPA